MNFIKIEPHIRAGVSRYNIPEVLVSVVSHGRIRIRFSEHVAGLLNLQKGDIIEAYHEEKNPHMMFLEKGEKGYKISSQFTIMIKCPFDISSLESRKLPVIHEIKDDGIYLYFEKNDIHQNSVY